MKSFFLPVGRYAGTSLPTLLSALSCGASVPVTGLDIFHITDRQPDPVLVPMIRDLNQAHKLFKRADNRSFFPSSFSYASYQPELPSISVLSSDPASASLLAALRGKGVPLSYKTDREAVEWAFSAFLSSFGKNGDEDPFRRFLDNIQNCISAGEEYRIAVLCDLNDPFSSGAAFALLRFLHESIKVDSSVLSLFCLSVNVSADAAQAKELLSSSLRALAAQNLVGKPDRSVPACADAVWLLSLPSSMVRSEDSLRIVYAVLAVHLARFFTAPASPSPGLHTVTIPGVLTFQSLGSQAGSFAAFLHASAWLLSDLIPAFVSWCDHPGTLRSLAPNSRNGLFRRLMQGETASPEQREVVAVIQRAFSAVLSEVIALIHFLPDQLRLAEVSDPLWRKAVEACGKTVTVASEYDVSKQEAEESGIMDVMPVHRVSMADTEEEKARKRLDEIAEQLKAETEARDQVFSSVGGCWALPALLDCRRRCQEALERVSAQLENLTPGQDHLSVASLSRRVRLLQAAVSRCDEDLAAVSFAGSGSASGLEGLTPFSSQLLNAPAAEKLSALLNASENNTDAIRKDLLAQLPSLLFGCSLSDVKTLFRQLLSCCKQESGIDPFASLCLYTLDVSIRELSALRFLSAGDVPSIPLLPDLYPSAPLLKVSSLLPLLEDSKDASLEALSAKRGLLAMLLLRQYRRRVSGEASLESDVYSVTDSPVLKAWLSARSSDSVRIFCLEKEDVRLPFALVLPGKDFLPARLSAQHAPFVPSFAAPWFDEETLTFRDPCALLSEGDRSILLEQLTAMTDPRPDILSGSLYTFLADFRQELLRHQEPAGLPDRLTLRLKAAFGLRLLPAFSDTLVRTTCFYERFLTDDPLSASLLARSSFKPSACSVPDDIVYLYRDVPFARENSRTLLDAIPLPAEDWILNLLAQESRTLSRASDDYHDNLVRELSLLLERYPDAHSEARQVAFDLLDKAGQPVTDTDTELTWPWDISSPSVNTILTESLGPQLAPAALKPFSDLLTLFPARGTGIIGDSLMASMCILPPAVVPEDEESAAAAPDAVLPPLSPDFSTALCSLPEGKTLFRPGLLSLERTENNAIRVSLTLEGSFTVRLIRVYAEEEILNLYAHDIPTLAVWPNLPFAPEDWHAYFTYASLPEGFSVSISAADGTSVSPESSSRTVCRTASFPLSFSLLRDGRSAGSVPNLLPQPDIVKQDVVTACVDFGSVGTSVIFSTGRQRRPLQGPTLVRTLINNPSLSRDLLRREFLPAVPVSALLPTASRIFRNVPGEAPLPFEDGIVLMSADLQDVLSIPSDALYTCLKWEEEKGRSVSLCLHQIMLMAALQARSDGAHTLLWRFSVPDDMAKTGRENLTALFASLAEQVCKEGGFPTPEKVPPVTFAAESSALGAYFRFCASEDTRGGFMVMDIGACTADISLFLRGREQAVRTCQIPLGVHYMLLPALLRNPSLLRQELSFIQDPSIQQDLVMLEQTIRNAQADPSALRHLRLALDNFIADHYAYVLPGLLQNPANGMPTRLGSVLLLHFSFLMMLSGLVLLQIAADPGKNDFLPEQMTLCLSGRGSQLMEYLPDPYKTALWHFLTMFRNRRVASLSFLFSSEKKMEIPVGLSMLEDVSPGIPAASTIPAAISVRPEELLPQFVLRFAKEFPASAQVLFNGFYTNDFYHPFSPWGESVITEAITQCFTPQTEHRPYDALSAWITTLLELIQTSS